MSNFDTKWVSMNFTLPPPRSGVRQPRQVYVNANNISCLGSNVRRAQANALKVTNENRESEKEVRRRQSLKKTNEKYKQHCAHIHTWNLSIISSSYVSRSGCCVSFRFASLSPFASFPKCFFSSLPPRCYFCLIAFSYSINFSLLYRFLRLMNVFDM